VPIAIAILWLDALGPDWPLCLVPVRPLACTSHRGVGLGTDGSKWRPTPDAADLTSAGDTTTSLESLVSAVLAHFDLRARLRRSIQQLDSRPAARWAGAATFGRCADESFTAMSLPHFVTLHCWLQHRPGHGSRQIPKRRATPAERDGRCHVPVRMLSPPARSSTGTITGQQSSETGEF
jgi:hypothetical protein